MTRAKGVPRSAQWLRASLSVFFFAGALWSIHRALAGSPRRAIVQSLAALSGSQIALAAFFAAASYVALGLGDALSFRFVGRQLRFTRLAITSFVSNAFANSVGMASLGGAPIRLRLLSAWGFSAPEVLQVTLFSSLTRLIGFLALGGVLFVAEPLSLPPALRAPFVSARPLGAAFLSLVIAYLAWSLWRPAPIHIAGGLFRPARPKLAVAQIVVSSLDWACSAATLFVLLGASGTISFVELLDAFLLAQAVGYLSSVPGGLGVFEGVFLLLLPASTPTSAAGALLAYRGVYYLLPLVLATVVMGAQEIRERRGARAGRVRRAAMPVEPHVLPEVFALSTFAGGVVLLLSGSTPAAAGRLGQLHHLLPLPVVELSHFLASLTGVALLVLSRGLHRRLDAAWVATVVLLAAGAVFSLAKGLDYEEAIVLCAMLTALLPCRRHFHRRSSLLRMQPEGQWIAAMATVVGASSWLAVFAHRHVEYSAEAWWRFALDSEAPRSLRAAVGTAVAATAIALARLFSPSGGRPALARDDELATARAVAASSTNSYANLVLRRDKALLFSPARNAFIMYGIFDRSYVAMGDPIGPVTEAAELVWRFRELCDRYGRWPVFFEVHPAYADLYLDVGLGLLKIGEEARVALPTFAIEAPDHANLRRARARVLRAGCAFEIIAQSEVARVLPDLRRVSDQWLAEKATREKGFSNAAFSEDYVGAFPAAVVRREGKIVAFANLWLTAEQEELSVDLMRFAPGAPDGVMDFLFTELFLWGRSQGYRWFNLGMAPLAGLEAERDAPLWGRVATFTFRHGEHFYNFQGLRRYKAKFRPEWETRYLASPGGLTLPRVLVDVTALIAGGITGIVRK
jgi:phosphatidylglycerol lysyltransferase